jgi:predicted lipoprotein with Yx(FWY)xxD motif
MSHADGEDMNDPSRDAGARAPRGRRPLGALAGGIVAALAIGVASAAVALAASGTPTVGSASNSQLGKRVAVSAQGRTLYSLSPETTHHLLCTSAACLKTWPPLTVPSRKTKLKAGSGVHGQLAILRRSDGRLQVTLRGEPLYRFAGDRGKDEANGEGIESFGGRWHAVTAAAGAGTPPATMPSTTPTTPSTTPTATTPETPGYGY